MKYGSGRLDAKFDFVFAVPEGTASLKPLKWVCKRAENGCGCETIVARAMSLLAQGSTVMKP